MDEEKAGRCNRSHRCGSERLAVHWWRLMLELWKHQLTMSTPQWEPHPPPDSPCSSPSFAVNMADHASQMSGIESTSILVIHQSTPDHFSTHTLRPCHGCFWWPMRSSHQPCGHRLFKLSAAIFARVPGPKACRDERNGGETRREHPGIRLFRAAPSATRQQKMPEPCRKVRRYLRKSPLSTVGLDRLACSPPFSAEGRRQDMDAERPRCGATSQITVSRSSDALDRCRLNERKPPSGAVKSPVHAYGRLSNGGEEARHYALNYYPLRARPGVSGGESPGRALVESTDRLPPGRSAA